MLCDWTTYDPSTDAVARDIVYPDDAVEGYILYHNPKHQYHYVSDQAAHEAWIMIQTDSTHHKGTDIQSTADASSKLILPRCPTYSFSHS